MEVTADVSAPTPVFPHLQNCGDSATSKNDMEPYPELHLTPEKPSSITEAFKSQLDLSLKVTPDKESVSHYKSKQRVRFEVSDELDLSNENILDVNQKPTDNSFIKSGPSLADSDALNEAFAGHQSSRFALHKTQSNEKLQKQLTFAKKNALLDLFDLKSKKVAKESDAATLTSRHIRPSLKKIPQNNQRDSVQRKINEMTRPTVGDSSQQSSKLHHQKNYSSSAFLKKKSGLKRYIHSGRKSEHRSAASLNDEKILLQPKYNSSLIHGQSLQLLKQDDFDALEAAIEKVDKDSAVKAQVKKVASAATNIDPEMKVYSNLISLYSSEYEENLLLERKPIKKTSSILPKPGNGPSINDMPVDDIVREVCIVEADLFKTCNYQPQWSQPSSVLFLYQRSLCWEEPNVI